MNEIQIDVYNPSGLRAARISLVPSIMGNVFDMLMIHVVFFSSTRSHEQVVRIFKRIVHIEQN